MTFVLENTPTLLPEQKIAFDAIIQAVADQSGGLYFLDAPGGIGEAFLISLILAKIRSYVHIALTLVSSGIAATLMEGGTTAHSALKLSLNMQFTENPTCNISKTSGMGKVFRACKIIVWDECTMALKKSLEALDHTLKDLRNNQIPFGGALVLLSGDSRQLLPVIPRSTPADELHACLKYFISLEHSKKMHLATNMRVKLQNHPTAALFSRQLLELGNGAVPTTPETGKITFISNFCNIVN